MRLDDYDPNIDVQDQGDLGRGGGGGGGLGGGLLFAFLPMIFNRFGCLGVVVVVGLFYLFSNGLQFVDNGGSGGTYTPTESSRGAASGAQAVCATDAGRKTACDAFSSADKTWAAVFQSSGQRYASPKLRFFENDGQSGCGAAQSAMGPFYCPSDSSIYLDTSFFDELTQRYRVNGDFAQDYVIAHEFGHHIQRLLGITARIDSQMQRSSEVDGNRLSVMLELQADCFAGVWAARNSDRLDPGDLEEGMTAANAIGDDTLQKQSQGRVVPDSFTHGSSAQRMQWLKRGMDSRGDYRVCDTGIGVGA